ncbi:DNA circularization N-terminal domain-containing protein [Pseudomonas syringae group sp. J309-1]|uniref:DNA circularization protein n=1 Tax=Pseudomonas syringae group sp. J309-1 TaxID=3079588 RepID=UPI00291574BC|nr:DNA circularization N-terminal domain-containing protein [Pseudomonas syringae group sp. J309-1]MDU8357977.1 DNA circularization N-terminal domain-containing protein [Pseudomonas syringae group sp. J309-1]
MAPTWRDSLLPASFRGIRFVVDSSAVPVGRKGQLHEYPQRDEPFFETLGKQAQVHKLAAFVIGEDCFERRDKLLEALEKEGPGELVHPWLGRIQVEVGECELQHDRREGGMARFDLTFYPEKPRKYPTATANTKRQVTQASEVVLDSSLGRYKAAMAKVDSARINVMALRNNLSGVYGVIQSQFSPFLGVYSNATAFANSLVNSPSGLSSMFSSFFAGFGGDGGSGSTGYRAQVADATRQAEAVSSINLVSQNSGADTGGAAQATANLVQDATLVKVAQVVADMPAANAGVPVNSTPSVGQQLIQPVERAEVPVADDVIDLRDTLNAAIWEASLKADPDHYQKLNALRGALVSHLTAVAASGVRLVDIKPAESLPALVLAYRRFGDATRSAEVVQRNRITHPGFVPPVSLKIAEL